MKSFPLALIIIILVVASGVAVMWTSRSTEVDVSRQVGSSLEALLNTIHQSLRTWEERTTASAIFIANSEEIRSAVERQVRVAHRRSDLIRSDFLDRLRRIFRPYVEERGYSDFAIISPDGTQVASGLDDFLGQDTIAKLNSGLLMNVFSGFPGVGEPFQLPDPHTRGHIRMNMVVGAPIYSGSGEVIAALVFRLDPAKEFGPLTDVGRLGRTGETLLFDKHANLLTPSRFHEDVSRVVPPNRSGQLVQLRDPGVNTTEGFQPKVTRDKQPLTRMAASAIRGESGIDLSGYRDYRGVPVAGTWIWDDELGLGLGTKIDLAEANAPIKIMWRSSMIMLGIVFTAVVLLLRVVAHRADLQAKTFGYEQALQARQDLLAVVAHDLRNPINSIALSSSVLTKALEDTNPNISFVSKTLGVIHRSAFRMNRLIEDLLTSTRIEAGQLQVRPHSCDLRPLLRDFEQMVRPLATEKSIELLCSIDAGVPHAYVDPDRLSQVLSNLVGNAIKYSPSHGVVVVSAGVVTDEIVFRVRDSGPGIAPSEVPRIFDRYWQAKHSKAGTGLGLFISKGLVEAHSGRIWVESAVGEGTTVYFTVPVAKVELMQPSVKRAG